MIDFLTITGGLVRDAELRYTQQGKAVAGFTIAQSDSRKNEQGDWENTRNLYLDVTVWNENPQYKQNPIPWAEIAGRLQKGDKVAVRGKLHTRQWEKDGQKRSKVEFLATELYVTPDTPQQSPQQNVAPQQGGWNQQPPQQQDPWNSAPQGTQQGFGGGPEDPPF